MSSYRLVIREQDCQVFDDIVSGLKTIETRAATPKYRGVTAGDRLTFSCGHDQVSKTVVRAEHFKDLNSLYDRHPVSKVLPSATSIAEAKRIHTSFPGYEDRLATYGIMAFELA